MNLKTALICLTVCTASVTLTIAQTGRTSESKSTTTTESQTKDKVVPREQSDKPADNSTSPKTKPSPGTQNQSKSDVAKKAERDTKKLTAHLGLSPEQSQRVKMIYTSYHNKAKADPANKSKHREVRDNQLRKELGDKLTPRYNEYAASPEGKDEDEVKNEKEGKTENEIQTKPATTEVEDVRPAPAARPSR
jgi:hypothetical protein